MDWQTKAAALNALAAISIKFRKPGDWYVSQQVEIKDGPILRGDYGNGATPQEAIEDHWERLTELEPGQYLVGREFLDGRTHRRKAVRWNGFMWEDVNEPAKPEAA